MFVDMNAAADKETGYFGLCQNRDRDANFRNEL